MEKGEKPKNRWYTVKGHKVSVRFSDNEYQGLVRRAASRELSVGLYLKWLFRNTRDDDGILEVERWNSDDEEPVVSEDEYEDW